jgi:hypothetical protein
MFLCAVALGEVVQLPSDNTLTMAPLKPGSTTDRYNSVGGVTGGSQVYICKFNISSPHLITEDQKK